MYEPINDSRYFEPPAHQDVDPSPECHESKEHVGRETYWAKQGCGGCIDEVPLLEEISFAVEVEFTMADLRMAKIWAEKRHFKYEDKRHLLWDWMTDGSREFKPVIPIGRDL